MHLQSWHLSIFLNSIMHLEEKNGTVKIYFQKNDTTSIIIFNLGKQESVPQYLNFVRLQDIFLLGFIICVT